jgi:hypothetical protein
MMANSTPRKLNLVFAFLFVFLSTCSAAPPQVSQGFATPNPAPPPAGVSPVTPPVDAGETSPSSEPAAIPSVVEVTPTAYLPLVSTTPAKFTGIYFRQYWNEENVASQMPQADQGAGKKHTSVGWFIDLEDDAFTIPVTHLPGNNLYRQLEELWKAGYISFVNVGTRATAAEINAGNKDREIGYLAEFYKAWIDLGNDRKAMIALLQEMNGSWTNYGESAEGYKQAYRRIVSIFGQKGVSQSQVWWVFAPNGWNDPAAPERAFENYYPGDDVVSFVGFSSYNYGYCPSTVEASAIWQSHQEIFEPFITRMQAMAPSKPVIIAETATTAYYDYDRSDTAVKDQWLIDNYNYLASHPAVIGVFYFSFGEFDGYTCDFEINPDGVVLAGYKKALENNLYQYLTVQDLTRQGY